MLDGIDFLARHLAGETFEVDGLFGAASGTVAGGTGGLAAEIVETVELVVLARAHLLLEGAAGLGLAGDLFWRRPCWDWKFVTWGVR